jgi:hypothetical protein
MSGIEIDKRSIVETRQKSTLKDGTETEYTRYHLNLPKEFIEKHKLKGKELYLVADNVWLGLPDEKALMSVLVLLPELKSLILKESLTDSDIEKIIQLNPEIQNYIERVIAESKKEED